LGYNAEILEDAGVNPDSLTSLAAYQTAFTAIETFYATNAMYDDFAVVSMAAGAGMTWVTGLHNFNGYLSAGLAYDDSSVIDNLNAGIADVTRLTAYADWVELLYTYADQTILLEGTYDTQVGKFAAGEAAFIHQGNWIDPNLMAYFNAEVDPYDQFEMGYAPHAAATGTEWMAAEKIYAWWQNDMPSGFGMDTLGPIYTNFANGNLTKAEFILAVQAKIEDIA